MHPLNGNPYQIIDGKRVFLEVAEPVAEPLVEIPATDKPDIPVFPLPK